MKISKLLSTRQALLRQTQLANLAYAYCTLQAFANRIARSKLHGLVKLRPADPTAEAFWPSLLAIEGCQSVVEEHFDDNDVIAMADAMVFVLDADIKELDFRLEELGDKYVAPLKQALENAGIVFDVAEEPSQVAGDGAE